MHYKDGTPAELGDIVQHDNGSVGIVIGGQVGSDFCSTNVVMFQRDGQYNNPASGYVGVLRNEKGEFVTRSFVAVVPQQGMQTREMVKIGHVDIGRG